MTRDEAIDRLGHLLGDGAQARDMLSRLLRVALGVPDPRGHGWDIGVKPIIYPVKLSMDGTARIIDSAEPYPHVLGSAEIVAELNRMAGGT